MGSGLLTVEWWEADPLPESFQRWGRDLDDANNIIGHPDCYYSMDPEKPYLLTFKKLNFANWNGKKASRPKFPDDLAPYVPDSDANGNIERDANGNIKWKDPVPEDLAEKYLVPNDSKMYKLKLVLSRILAPSADGRNEEFLSRIRMGVATSMYERAAS